MSTWRVYLLQCADGTYYCGITNNLERRIKQHNGLLRGGPVYTRSRRPARLLGSLPMPGRSEALKAEAAIKKMKRPAKLACFSGGALCPVWK